MKFGLIPEFIGRLPVITTVRPLDRAALIEILTEPKNALVKQYARLFELDGVELEFADDALEAIADQAVKRGTGARGLRAIMEEVLLSVMYEVPSREDVAKVVITAETVLEHVYPTLVPRADDRRRRRRSPPDLRLPHRRLGCPACSAVRATVESGRASSDRAWRRGGVEMSTTVLGPSASLSFEVSPLSTVLGCLAHSRSHSPVFQPLPGVPARPIRYRPARSRAAPTPFTFQALPDPGEGQRWSTWNAVVKGAHGPQPRPSWVITSDAALDTELGVLKTGKEADVFLIERAVPGAARPDRVAGRQAVPGPRAPQLPPRRRLPGGPDGAAQP